MKAIKMIQNLHTHTTFCDGRNTPEEMICAAIECGFTSLGFSSHANTCFADSCEMGDGVEAYKREITRLKNEYDQKIKIYLGTELDTYSEGYMDMSGYDYKIASVHYAVINGEKVCYDFSVAHAEDIIARHFGGDGMGYAALYFETMATMPTHISGDFVGHFDLLTKYEEKAPRLFDTGSAKYRKMALDALDAVRERFDVFELNVGSVARGYKSTPYPAPFILDRMRELDCKMVITTDCHNKSFLNYGFDSSVELLRSHGFSEIYNFDGKEFVGAKI